MRLVEPGGRTRKLMEDQEPRVAKRCWSRCPGVMILRDAFLGTTRFGDFQRGLGLAKNILADRLDGLVRGGVLAREGSPARPEYRLTPKGKDLAPALVALMQWGDRWLSDDAPPILLSGPGGPVLAVALRTAAGPVEADALQARPGPGADGRTRAFLAGRDDRRP